MKIGTSSNMDTKLNTSLANELLKKKLDKKEDDKTPVEALVDAKIKGVKILLKGKSSKMLDELNKQKINPDILEKALEKLKKEKLEDDDKKSDKIDLKDKNRDGKVSQVEKNEALKKDEKLDVKDKNKDGKVSFTEEQEFKKKKSLNLVKKVIEEIKKDNDIKDVKPSHLKNISKLVNEEILPKEEASKINTYLEN